MSLLSNGEFAGLRSDLDILLTHTYTRQGMTIGSEDAEGNTPSVVDGAPTIGVPCRLETINVTRRDEGGITLVSVPRLFVSATDTLKVGDQVTNVTDQLGVIKVAGPLRVERSLDDTDGLGATLAPSWELRSGSVS